MNKLILIILILFLGFSCKKIDQTEKLPAKIDRLHTNGLNALKSTIDKMNLPKKSDSVKFYEKNVIGDFLFIRDLFPIEEIDSIEIYGTFNKKLIQAKKIPENSLLIIYFNKQRLAKNRLNLLQFEWNDYHKVAEVFYKKGAITFELDRQLCVYLVNSCENEAKSIKQIDITFKTALHQKSYDYERIISDCGTVSFERRVN
ncbi:hypothetical protein IMCC3317_43380 [Kordia antarctica]|uniref:Lipoprotein n=1 Tax=Kordia antarctica TaxID=1218801 RepID=A0A7L4ZQE0_9FLAO|nr:hypothetical protein [Kordia antarctica]QHI38938.1 hypothetical protein IMCC3317_43380 [Kordia antarctica]